MRCGVLHSDWGVIQFEELTFIAKGIPQPLDSDAEEEKSEAVASFKAASPFWASVSFIPRGLPVGPEPNLKPDRLHKLILHERRNAERLRGRLHLFDGPL